VPTFSAGILLHRRSADDVLEVLIVHPGGPFWAKKDAGSWSVPKGEYTAAAQREFAEELGRPVPDGDPVDLGEFRQPSGKRVRVYAVAADLDADLVQSNTFELEWPPRSGRTAVFPEVDRAAWRTVEDARVALTRGQVPVLDALVAALAS
jgi:predicted NUDIX family NTP pyrophosphohydrolase